MDSSELQELLNKDESLKLDFKRELKLYDQPPAGTNRQLWSEFKNGQWDELIKDIIALANGNVGTLDQDGILVIGADDELPTSGKRQVYDTSQLQITAQQILSRVNSACDPPIPDLKLDTVELEGKQVLVITIPPSSYIHETTREFRTTKGNFDSKGKLRYCEIGQTYSSRTAFIRRGESIFPATASERQQIANERIATLERASKSNKLDRELFLKIRDILKSTEVISFLRETDFGGAFETRRLTNLYDFEQFCEHPECEFMDENMEELKKQLLDAVKAFLRATGKHTFPERVDPRWNRIPRDPMQEPEMIAWFREKAENEEDFQKLIANQREHLLNIWRELNQLAQHLCDAYDEFLRSGRRKLTV